MDIFVGADRTLRCGDQLYRCALGRGGIALAKREGDGTTPAGSWPLRRVLYRADRIEKPVTSLPLGPLAPEDGWCDDPGDPDYNRMVHLPHAACCERMWREDRLYDLVVVLGYNDAPAVPGLGSAIFLHVARDDMRPTEGCVALARADLLSVVRRVDATSALTVRAP